MTNLTLKSLGQNPTLLKSRFHLDWNGDLGQVKNTPINLESSI